MVRRVLRRLYAALGSARTERDLHHELQFHLDRQTAEYVRGGMSPADARAAARRDFGGVEQAKEACRDARGRRRLRELQQDLWYAGRMLRRDPALTAVVMVTLGIGIGANAAIFSVVDAVLLKPLPYADAQQLVVLKASTASRPDRAVAFPDFLDWRARQSSFEDLAATLIIGGVLSGDGRDAERVFGRAVTRQFFATLGAPLQHGRTFTAEEDQPGGARVIVFSHAVWQRRYGGAPDIVGRAANYNGESYTIIGILPKTFDFYGRTNANNDIFVPLGQLGTQVYMRTRDNHPVSVIGRMKPGVTLERARADLSAIAAALAAEHPSTNRGVGATVTPLLEDYVGDMRPALAVLLGASWLLLTIACVNVANLLLARASSRRPEIALRLALGAGRGRVIGQLLTESLVLSSLGGALGLLLAWLAAEWLAQSAPLTLSRIEEVVLDSRVVLFGVATVAITGVAFGLAPAMQTSGVDLQQVMRASGRAVTGSGKRVREALVVGQVALCVASRRGIRRRGPRPPAPPGGRGTPVWHRGTRSDDVCHRDRRADGRRPAGLVRSGAPRRRPGPHNRHPSRVKRLYHRRPRRSCSGAQHSSPHGDTAATTAATGFRGNSFALASVRLRG